MVRQHGNGTRGGTSAHGREDVRDDRLYGPHHVGRCHEGHLEVDLREFGLSIGAQVLVPEAAHDLVVAVDPAHHQDLLEQLGGLGQRVERPSLHPARHQVVARALRRGAGENRRFHLDEPGIFQTRPHHAGDLVAEAKALLHGGTTEIEVAILQAQLLIDLVRNFRVIHRKREHVGRIQEDQRCRRDFDFSGGDFGIVRPRRAGADLASNLHHAFTAESCRLLEKLFRQIRGIKNGLSAALTVADVYKNQAAQVAARVDPTG